MITQGNKFELFFCVSFKLGIIWVLVHEETELEIEYEDIWFGSTAKRTVQL